MSKITLTDDIGNAVDIALPNGVTISIVPVQPPVQPPAQTQALVEVNSFTLPNGIAQTNNSDPIQTQVGDYLIAGMVAHGKSVDPSVLWLSDSKNIYNTLYASQTSLGAIIAQMAITGAGPLTLSGANKANYMSTGIGSWLIRGGNVTLLADKIMSGTISGAWGAPSINDINLPANTFAIVLFDITASGPFGVNQLGIPWTLNATGTLTKADGTTVQNYWVMGSLFTAEEIINGMLGMTNKGGQPSYNYVIIPFEISDKLDSTNTIYNPALPDQTPNPSTPPTKPPVTTPPPSTAIDVGVKTEVVALGMAVSYQDYSTPPDGLTISSNAWTFGDGGVSNESNGQYLYNKSGTYNVVETVTYSDGAIAAQTTSINIGLVPSIVPDGLSILYHMDTNQFVESVAWNFGDGSNGSDADGRHSYSAAGNYTITGSVSYGGSVDRIDAFGPISIQVQ